MGARHAVQTSSQQQAGPFVWRRNLLPFLSCLLGLFGLCVTVCLALGAPAQGVAASRAIPTSTAASTAVAATATSAETVTIHITGADQPPGFLPDLISVHVNAQVEFLNDASTPATYTIMATDHSFTSPAIAPGQQWTTIFTTPGVYDYSDPAHSAQMVGEVVVVPSDIQLLPTPAPGAIQTAIAQDLPQATPTTVATATPAPATVRRSSASGLPVPLIVGGLVALLAIAAGAWYAVNRARRRKPQP